MSTRDGLISWDDGVKAFDAGDYAKALQLFEESDDTARMQYNRGITLVKLGRMPDAMAVRAPLAARSRSPSAQRDPRSSRRPAGVRDERGQGSAHGAQLL